MWRDVKDSEWSANHIARHDVTMEEVRDGEAFIVTARDMTDREKRTYKRKAR